MTEVYGGQTFLDEVWERHEEDVAASKMKATAKTRFLRRLAIDRDGAGLIESNQFECYELHELRRGVDVPSGTSHPAVWLSNPKLWLNEYMAVLPLTLSWNSSPGGLHLTQQLEPGSTAYRLVEQVSYRQPTRVAIQLVLICFLNSSSSKPASLLSTATGITFEGGCQCKIGT